MTALRNRTPFVVASLLLFFAAIAWAQQSGTNTNVLPSYGTDKTRGDYYRQRQVEPAVAASSWDSDTILSAFIDFRTVDGAGSPEAGTFGEAWMGVSRSYDRGSTWAGALVPGFLGDTSPAGQASPLLGLSAAGDPVLTPNVNGWFHLGGLFFERGGIANIGVATYRDERDTEGGDSIRYKWARIIDKGSAADIGNFNDKPSIAADVPRGPGQSECGNVYIAYTTFHGNKGNGFTTKVGFSRSLDCGRTWSHQLFLNKNYSQNQGTSMAIDPRNGKIYVVWRHVMDGNKLEHALLMATSDDYGETFTDPEPVAITVPFDQIPIPTVGNNGQPQEPAFRMNAFPAIAVDRHGNLFVAVQERGYGTDVNSPRIVIRTRNADTGIWSSPEAIEVGPLGAHQVMPVMSYSGGVLRVMWYDFREARTESNCDERCSGNRPLTPTPGDDGWISGFDRQMNVRVAQWSSPAPSGAPNPLTGGNPSFGGSVQVSKYQVDSVTGKVEDVPNHPTYAAVNRANLPMYVGGIMPFASDYMGLMSARQYTKTDHSCQPVDTAKWRWSTEDCDLAARSSYAVWYDTRDVVFPSGGLEDIDGWQAYAAPGKGCVNFGSRDGNTYFAEINPGIVVGSPSPSRQLIDGNAPVVRALPYYVKNPNPSTCLDPTAPPTGPTGPCADPDNPYGSRFFHFTLATAYPNDVTASLFPFEENENGTPDLTTAITEEYAEIMPYSTISSGVYIYCGGCDSSVRSRPVTLTVEEIDISSCGPDDDDSAILSCDPMPGGLTGSFTFNEGPGGSPDVAVPGSQETYSLDISNPQYRNPQFRNPQYRNPQYRNPQFRNPQFRNAPEGDPIAEFTWTVENTSDVATAITSITTLTNPEDSQDYLLFVARQYDLPPDCDGLGVAQEQIISMVPDPQFANPQYRNPQFRNPQFRNPQFRNPQFRNPQFRNPQFRNSTFAASPLSDSGTSSSSVSSLVARRAVASEPHSDTRAPRPTDKITVTLLVYGNTGSPLGQCNSDDCDAVKDFLNTVSQTAIPQAGDNAPLSNKLFSLTGLNGGLEPPANSEDPWIAVLGDSLTATVSCDETIPNVTTGEPPKECSSGFVPGGKVVFFIGEQALPPVDVVGVGVATLPEPLEVGTYEVRANYLGDENFNGSTTSLLLTVEEVSTTVELSFAPTGPVLGDEVVVTATITPADEVSETLVPGGEVTFTVNGVPEVEPALVVEGDTPGTGKAELTLPNQVAAFNVTAEYSGDLNFKASSTLEILPVSVAEAPTTVELTSSPANPVIVDTVVVNVTVVPTGGMIEGFVPNGNVGFSIDGTPHSEQVAVTAGELAGTAEAVLSLPPLERGPHTIQAEYLGDSNFEASPLVSLTVTVQPANTSVAVVDAPASSVFGEEVTITATVVAEKSDLEEDPVPVSEGLVRFKVGSESQDVDLAGSQTPGEAVATFLDLSVGTLDISVEYLGTEDYIGSTAPSIPPLSVEQLGTTTELTVSGNQVYGETLTFTAKVSATAGVPTGTIVFDLDGVPRPEIALPPSGEVSTDLDLPAGTPTVTATYSGSSDHLGSEDSEALNVLKADTTTTLELSPPNPGIGADITLTATVSSGVQTPEGTVRFTIVSTVGSEASTETVDATLAAGTATATVTIGAGDLAISAQYLESNNFNPSLSDETMLSLKYAFTGFFSPLSSAANISDGQPYTDSGTRNLKSGLPIKWSLQAGAAGFITDLTTLQSLMAIGCNGNNRVVALYSPGSGAKGGSTFTASGDQFHFNWDTKNGKDRGCFQILAEFDDGSAWGTQIQLQ
jgi:Big-like domain-containing protein